MIRRTTLYLAALLLLGIGAISPAANATPPTPISSCTPAPYTITASGNYIVTANLTTTGTCILIEASDVAIDLQGHSITGSGTDEGIVSPIPETNIIVANGTVKDFNIGIALGFDTYVTISNINAMQNVEFGIGLGGNSTVNNSQANNNGNGSMTGDIVTAGGIGIAGGTVTNSQANNNNGFGIGFILDNNTVNNSTANNNAFNGIEGGGSNNTVTNSPANNNGLYGIAFMGGNNVVTNSPANNNGLDGIAFAGGSNIISNSRANGNKGNGIAIVGDDNLLTSDTANSNVGVGIALTCPSNLFGETAKGNGINTFLSGSGCVELDDNF